MSWGERSCINIMKSERRCEPKLETCNVNCLDYKWDGRTEPDSHKKDVMEKILAKIEERPKARKSRAAKNRAKRRTR
jgi:hypothetical protein